jgi:rubrerythrin
MPNWSLNDIEWNRFNASRVNPELVPLVKAACMVEHNSQDYDRYLHKVFEGDAAAQEAITEWAREEVQHGQALRKWAELADPEFDFDESFRVFTTGYKLPDVSESVRGSRFGELIARCVVESGTSSYYTAIREYTDEPVLQDICARIAADEFRHYKLFYDLSKQYHDKDKVGFMERLYIAAKRVAESDDDELSYAFFAASGDHGLKTYERKRYAAQYFNRACRVYKKPHVERMSAMIFKAVGLKPHTPLHRVTASIAWKALQYKGQRAA